MKCFKCGVDPDQMTSGRCHCITPALVEETLHPLGACTCYGEGWCSWCLHSAALERIAELEAEAEDLRHYRDCCRCADLVPLVDELKTLVKEGASWAERFVFHPDQGEYAIAFTKRVKAALDS